MPKRLSRILWVSLAVFAVLILAVYMVISSKVHAFLRSEDFRKLVSEKTGDAFRSEASYTPLKWAGSSVFSDSLEATGNPGSIVSSVKASQVRADVNWRAIFDGAWRVDRVDVLNFQGVFRPGSPEAGKDGGDPPVAASGWEKWLPSRFELGQLDVSQANISFLGQDGNAVVVLSESTLKAEPNGDGWTIEGNGGTLALTGLPQMSVANYRTRIQGGVFFLTDTLLRLGEAGKISASGEFADNSKLKAQWEQVDIAPFLTAEWKNRFSGFVAGTADIEWPSAGMAAGEAKGTFHVTDGLVQNIGTLEEVAKFTGAPQFRRMPVQQFSGTYKWARGNLSLTNLVLESKGLLRVEGTCDIAANRQVAGKLRIGVTPQTLQWLPGSRERVFTVSQNGYLWTDLRIGGTLDNLSEDLSSRLANAMKDEVIDQGIKAIDVLPGATKDGVKDGVKGVKDVLDALTPMFQ